MMKCFALCVALNASLFFVSSALCAARVIDQKSENQETVEASNKSEYLADFDTGIDWLSSHYKLTLIAEDAPLKKKQSIDDVQKSIDSIQKSESEATPLIDAFANLYDYSVSTRSKMC